MRPGERERGGAGLEAEIAALERARQAGQADPQALLRLSRLYLRGGRAVAARAALQSARDGLDPLVQLEDGAVELRSQWSELHEELERVEAEVARQERATRRAELMSRRAEGPLGPGESDELIRLQLADGLPLQVEEPVCPACGGALEQGPDGLRCARSGREGDLCRHTDARGLFACPGCGQLVRAWNQRALGRLEADPREPPLALPAKSRCGHCGGQVADWKVHFIRCPKARPADFPVCDVCRRRGHHARELICPRCQGAITRVPCME